MRIRNNISALKLTVILTVPIPNDADTVPGMVRSTSTVRYLGMKNVRFTKRQVSKRMVSKRPVFKFDILIKHTVFVFVIFTYY
jgi:hypothetical protein